MSYPTLCIDNFLENPDEIVEYSNRLNFIKAEHGRWPGLRVDLSLDPVGPFLMQKIVMEIWVGFMLIIQKN